MKKTIILLSAVFGLMANAQTSWNLLGNAGTNPPTSFIGTTDSKPLVLKTKSDEKMRITTSNRFIFFGVTTPGQVWDKNLFFGGGVDNPSNFGNVAFGLGSYTQNTVGNSNTAIGNNAMSLATTGDGNTSLGSNTMRNSESGFYNTAVGMNAMETFKSGSYNTAVGSGSLAANSLIGDANTGVGVSVLRYLNSGTGNVAVGFDSYRALTTGSYNISVGYSNAKNIVNGSNNIFIGNNITPYAAAPENELNIGNWIVGNNGVIGIGQFTNQLPADGITSDGYAYKLFVKDGIRTEKVKVDVAASNGWADYVFEKDYKLMSLTNVEKFIKENGHLPEVPTTEEAIKNGIELKEMNILLLKKIEELTLYTIEQQKRIEALEKKVK